MTIITAAIPAADMTAAITKNQLRQNIEKILSRDDVASATVGVCILAGDTGDILYEKNGEVPLKPASCNKLQVTAAALHFLGPDYTYKTSLQITGKIRNKTLVGDVVVSGSGDPSISGRFGKDKSDNTAIFRDWAKALKRMGIEKIEGNIVGDDDYFGDDTFGQGWSPNSRSSWFSAEVSALSFNDNCVDVVWSGNGAVGKTAPYKLNPPTSYVKITNEVRIGKKGTDKTSSFHRKDKSNEIVARGMIPKGGTMSDSAAVYNPTHYFVSVLKETLEKERIPVMGKAIDLIFFPSDGVNGRRRIIGRFRVGKAFHHIICEGKRLIGGVFLKFLQPKGKGFGIKLVPVVGLGGKCGQSQNKKDKN